MAAETELHMAGNSVRQYVEKDRDTVVRMLADSDPWKRLGYTKSDWNRLFESRPQGRDCFVIEANGAVVGLALLRQRFMLGDYLELLAVAPWSQGHGFGSTLLRHLEQIVFARTKNLFVCVSDFNSDARRFYAKHGYQEIGPIPNFLIPGSSEILLRKTTGPVREAGQ
jgi:ribosomal protein S18 acetylase RimI-like enzyme